MFILIKKKTCTLVVVTSLAAAFTTSTAETVAEFGATETLIASSAEAFLVPPTTVALVGVSPVAVRPAFTLAHFLTCISSASQQ